jgi:hypothetical protein
VQKFNVCVIAGIGAIHLPFPEELSAHFFMMSFPSLCGSESKN